MSADDDRELRLPPTPEEWDTLKRERDELLERASREREAAVRLLKAAKHVVMEWRLHGQLTDSARVLEKGIAAYEEARHG